MQLKKLNTDSEYSCLKTFKSNGNIEDYVILALLPNYIEQENSSAKENEISIIELWEVLFKKRYLILLITTLLFGIHSISVEIKFSMLSSIFFFTL